MMGRLLFRSLGMALLATLVLLIGIGPMSASAATSSSSTVFTLTNSAGAMPWLFFKAARTELCGQREQFPLAGLAPALIWAHKAQSFLPAMVPRCSP